MIKSEVIIMTVKERRKEAEAYCSELYAATKEVLFWLGRMARVKNWREKYPHWADELQKAKARETEIKAKRG